MGIGNKLGYVVNRIASRGACSEMGRANIDGVGTTTDGFDATGQVFGRRQQFYATGSDFHGFTCDRE